MWLTCRTHAPLLSVQFSYLAIVFFLCDRVFLCRVGSANGNHFGCQLVTGFRKPTFQEWIHISDDSSSNLGEQCIVHIPTMVQDSEYKDCTTKHERPEEALSAPRSSWQAGGEHDTPTWTLSGTQRTASFWERTEAPLPPPRPGCNVTHPKQLSPPPERLKLPFFK